MYPAESQYILYIVRPSTSRPGKTDKFPINPQTGQVANAHDPSIWLSLTAANERLQAGVGEGIGFVFTEADPYFFLDIDGAYAGGQWSAMANRLCGMFPGCFIEVSHSGTGLHIIGSAAVRPQHGTRCKEHGLELYTSGRFVALTGRSASGSVLIDASPALAQIAAELFPPTAAVVERAEWSDGPVPEWNGPESDEDLISKMRASRPSAASAFAGGATVGDLLDGDMSAYADDHSAADQALCNHLAFWTGKDCDRMDRIFRTTPLMRDKWDRSAGPRGTYGQVTILNAVAQCNAVYGGKPDPVNAPAPKAADPETGLRTEYQFMSIGAQIDYFQGCVYIDQKSEIWCPDGQLRNKARFDIYRGGYSFALDAAGKKTANGAWDAFTVSQGYDFPKADACCFRPECGPGEIIEEEGFRLLNTFYPVQTRRIAGDASLFIDLLCRLLPDARDREILTCYLAACLQYPGVKFQWWPVIQGVRGNGKSAIMRIMTHAIGNRYTHKPNAESMIRTGNQFNSWIDRKLFVGIEELKAGDQRGFLEAFKTTVTEDRIQIEGKGGNQIMGDNRANGLINTNHKDGAPIDDDERRYAVFFTAQQSKADLVRDGLTPDYFYRFYSWLKADGCAIVNNFLRTYKIAEEFNPATLCQRAPVTSSTAEAVDMSRGGIEQAIEEAVKEGRLGFCGGWVSSFALEALLVERRAANKISHVRRNEILKSLGFTAHPALGQEGRVNNPFTDPGSGKTGKPKLFIRNGHIACNVNSAAETVKLYCAAQSEGATLAGGAFAANN